MMRVLASNVFAYMGSKGNTIEKDIMLMKAARYKEKKEECLTLGILIVCFENIADQVLMPQGQI